MTHNDAYLVPITNRIGDAIIEFCCIRREFHADDLRAFVTERCGAVAPGSADRILRNLRSKGLLDYVVCRSESLYTVVSVRDAA